MYELILSNTSFYFYIKKQVKQTYLIEIIKITSKKYLESTKCVYYAT